MPEQTGFEAPHPRYGAPTTTGELPAEHPYFPVATHKFVVLSICTLGLYDLYWFYQNWQRVRRRTREDLSPFWRAAFAPLNQRRETDANPDRGR